MALELLKGFKFEAEGAALTKTVELTVGELFSIAAMNQDQLGDPTSPIPKDVHMSIQEKIVSALRLFT